MTDQQAKKEALYRKRPFHMIWLVPLLAFSTVAWMAWQSWHQSGPIIHITFSKVEGIDANRTLIRHKGVTLGTVKSVAPSKDFSHVIVTAEMDSMAQPFLQSGSQFWVVHPRVSVGSISDLNTLVSGVYIELDPGNGDAASDFTGLDQPLAVDQREPGKNFTLQAAQLGSLERGSPLYFHGMQVGQVTGFDLSADQSVQIHIFLNAPYDKLVYQQTRFWNVSGVGLTAGPQGFKISAQSLQSIVQGGIDFDVPPAVTNGDSAAPEASFTLYADRDTAFDSVYTKKITYQLQFTGSIQGLDPGSAVTLLGDRIGHVVETRIDVDGENGEANSRVIIEIQPEHIHFLDGELPTGNDIEQRSRAAFRQMVKRGLRAQLVSGNLLTGQKNIDLAFVPDVAPATIAETKPYAQFPAIPAQDMQSLIQDAHNTLSDADKTIKQLGTEIQPLADSLKSAADQLNSGDSNGGLSGTLYELKRAAQSVRTLADYLDAHPEAILRGKKESP